MTKDADNIELTDRQKTRLLHVALHPPEPSDPENELEEKGDLLCDILRRRLPCEEEPGQEQGGSVHPFPLDRYSVTVRSIGELLQDPRVSVTELRCLKQYAKTQGGRVTSAWEKDVFLAVYFAAIARALLNYGEHITTHAKEDTVRFSACYASARWIPSSLQKLFDSAAHGCQEAGRTEI